MPCDTSVEMLEVSANHIATAYNLCHHLRSLEDREKETKMSLDAALENDRFLM